MSDPFDEFEPDLGWPPLVATGRKPIGGPEDSLRQIFVTQDGQQEFVSQFDLGPEPHHQTAFIEYERTFGRGKAFGITHDDGYHRRPFPGQPERLEHRAVERYKPLAANARYMMLRATQEQVTAFVEQLSCFRCDFQELYDDVREAKRPAKTFVMKEINPPKK
jgi:hypothetical protein